MNALHVVATKAAPSTNLGPTVLIVERHPLLRTAVAMLVTEACSACTVTAIRALEDLPLDDRNARWDVVVAVAATVFTTRPERQSAITGAQAVVVTCEGPCDSALLITAARQGARHCVDFGAGAAAIRAVLEAAMAPAHSDGPAQNTAVRALPVDPVSPRHLMRAAHRPALDGPTRLAGIGDRLTRRQSDVFEALLRGRSNKEIALELGLAVSTVKLHVGAVLAALQVRSRAQAIALVAGSLDRES